MFKKMRWAQIRKKTASRKMRDKVAHPDPAIVPLGTDEEAGGAKTALKAVGESVDTHAGDGNEGREEADEKRPQDAGKTDEPID